MKTPAAILLSLLLLFASCKKDPPFPDNIPNGPNDTTAAYRPPWPMIKTRTLSSSSGAYIITSSFYYDSLWRIIKLVDTGSSNHTAEYTYGANTVSTGGGFLSLSNLGLASYEYNWSNSTNYSFNADSMLTSAQGEHYGTTNSYSNKNMASKQTWSENGGWGLGMHDYTYTHNTHANTIGNYNMGQYFFGRSSVNLIQHVDWHRYSTNGGGSGTFGFTDYTYTYNDSGWVHTVIVRDATITPTYIDSVTTVIDTLYNVTNYQYTYY